jgi:hypothetical protein
MTPPSEGSSDHIDMFRVRQELSGPLDRYLPAPVHVVPEYPRYHSIQLAVVIGLFACGGLICSMLLVVGSEDLPPPHYSPRKSYSSPALVTPQRPVVAPAAQNSVLLR